MAPACQVSVDIVYDQGFPPSPEHGKSDLATLVEGVGLAQFTEALAKSGAMTHYDLHYIDTSALTANGDDHCPSPKIPFGFRSRYIVMFGGI